MNPMQPISEQLQQALATAQSTDGHIAAAYAALQQNGASLPAKRNAENLAEVIEDSKYAGVALRIKAFGGNSHNIEYGELVIKNSATQNYATYFVEECYSKRSSGSITVATPLMSTAGSSSDKSNIAELYIDGTGDTTANRDYLCGANTNTYNFENLQKFELKGLETVGSNLCSYAFELTDVILHEGLKITGINAFYGCRALKNLKLPDSLTTVDTFFCYNCNSLQEIYIPAGCTPPTDNNSLSTTSSTATSYTNGIVLKGPGAKAWKAALPNRTSSPYRKLILDPEWA